MTVPYRFGSGTISANEVFFRQLQADFDALQVSTTWTPVLTFATPGDLNVVYSSRSGSYFKIGSLITVRWSFTTSTFTFTTASGELRITGLPFASEVTAGNSWYGMMTFQGITKANYTQFTPLVQPNTSLLVVSASGQGQVTTTVAAADMPTGGTVSLAGTLTYKTS